MSPDEIIPDGFRGASSIEKKWKPIFSAQGFVSRVVYGKVCYLGGCCKTFKRLVYMFQPISLIWLIRLVKNHRWIKSTQNALSNGEISTVLASIVKKLQINIYKLPPGKKMVANNQPMFWSFSNAEPGVQATCHIIHRRAGVIHVIAGMFFLLLGCCCCWWECYVGMFLLLQLQIGAGVFRCASHLCAL